MQVKLNAVNLGEQGFMLSLRLEGNPDIQSDIGVMLPTYCEAANVEKLINEIERLKLNASILVIDDSSPDHTAEIIRRLQNKYPNLLLVVRPTKSGLGTAITDGFKIFLSLKHPPKRIITMDSDFSHNPRDISRVVDAVPEECDLVIGSRYCSGGGTKDWGVFRMVISKIANLITSLRIDAGISDYTSGMRCYSTRLVSDMINDLHSRTYEIQIETIRQAHMRRFRIMETPIVFVNRKKGKSKLSMNEIKDFLSYILPFNRKY